MQLKLAPAGGLALALVCGASSPAASGASAPQVVSSSTTASGGTTISGMPADEAPLFGTGAISGVVTDGNTGVPLEGVLVTLSGGRAGTLGRPQMMTDARGRFIFTHLVAFGDYAISAARMGYVDGGYKRLPGSSVAPRISLRDGEWFPSADVRLWKPASISGTVLDDQNEAVVGVPIRVLAKVRVAGRIRVAAGPSTVTDDRGMYRLSGLSPGEYIVHVPGVQVTYPAEEPKAQATAPAPPSGLSVTSNAPDPDAVLRLDGGLTVSLGPYATPPAGGGAAAYAMAYHPASRSMDTAAVISLDYGDQRQNVDVQLTLLPTVRVSGRVLGPGDTVAKLPIRLLSVGSEGLGHGAEAAMTTTDATGAFTLLKVPAGDYTLIASRSASEFTLGGGVSPSSLVPARAFTINSMSSGTVTGSNGLSMTSRSVAGTPAGGRTTVSVADRDLDDVVVTLAVGSAVSGHFLWDGSETLPAGAQVPFMRLEPADGDLSLALRSPSTPGRFDGAPPSPVPFTIDGVLPGKYVFGSPSAGRFSIESIEWKGRDMIATPLDVEPDQNVSGVVVRLTSKPIQLTGAVRDGSGAPATGGAVIAFPAQPALWRNFGLSANLFRTGSIVADGTYRLDRILPGEYLLAAVPDEDRPRWVDPDYLASIAGSATRISVTPGSTVTQNLRLTGGDR
jgi:hypothetical protein